MVEDLSFILPRSTPAERLVTSIKRAGAPLVELVVLMDTYEGEAIPEGSRSLTYTVVYRAPDHTLTNEEVGAVRARIVQACRAPDGGQAAGLNLPLLLPLPSPTPSSPGPGPAPHGP